VIIDYQSPTNFKFVGIDVSLNKFVMGHRTAGGWVVDVQTPLQVKPDIFYDVLVAVNGTFVTVTVDGATAFSYTFPKQIVDGVESGLNKGMIGVGSKNARGTFDDIAVQILPPAITLDRTENFDTAAPPLFPAPSGTWTVGNGRYVTPGAGAMSAIDLGATLRHSSYVELTATLSTTGMGGIFFDAQPTGAYKFVMLDVPGQRVVVGHYTHSKGLVVDVSAPRALLAGTDYSVSIVLKGAGVSVSVGGVFVLSFGFNSALPDGRLGVIGVTGTTSVDSFRIRTNDPAFLSAEASGIPAVSVNATGGFEGAAGTTRTVPVTLSLSAPAIGGETVRWATANGTATAGSDYVAASGTVTFAPGAASATISVTLIGDGSWEGDESFSVVLSAPTGLRLGATSALVSIMNDDAAPTGSTGGGGGAMTMMAVESTTTTDTKNGNGRGPNTGGDLLMAVVASKRVSAAPLTKRSAAKVLRAAISRWVAAGMRRGAYAGVRVKVARLPGAQLAKVVGRTIVVDADAAGWGWHLGLRGRVAAGRIDLLTVLLHELGHLAGLEHGGVGVMEPVLAPGERRLARR
jgi:Calx-beta domain